MKHKLSRGSVVVAVTFTLSAAAHAAPEAGGAPDLSLEELMRTDVVTASRKSQAVQDVAAAVFVITRDDIERSGSTSLPEVLRLAPGVEVARLASGRWAVSARGFNGRFANKLLVLMDGRSIYSPLFSGVLWELEGTLLEDVERIEVIRGPGAALWGANAVNGVINIITRKARDTQGNLVAAGAGNIEKGSLAARHGSTLDSGQYRVWAKTESYRNFEDSSGNAGNDNGRTTRAGFRADWNLPSGDGLMLSGVATTMTAGDVWNEASLTSPYGYTAADRTERGEANHLLARYSRLAGDGSETVVQTYLERGRLRILDAFEEHRTTFDLDVQHRPRLGGAHDVVLGGTYRVSRDSLVSTGIFCGDPPRRTVTLASVFVTDEFTLAPEQLRATLGARLEHNSFTGFEPQPHVRLAWTPNRSQTVWTAVSRAVRTPSRAEVDFDVDLAVVPANPPVPPVLLRNTAPVDHVLQAEIVNAFELGFRQQFEPNLSIDMAAFHNRYSRLSGDTLGTQDFSTGPVPHVIQNLVPANALSGNTTGLEIALDWRPLRHWRLQAAYSYLTVSIDAPANDPVAAGVADRHERSAPRQQLMLRASVTPLQGHDLDARLRYVSSLGAGTSGSPLIDAYTALDLRYAWRVLPGLVLSITGENLLQRSHAEFAPDLLPSQQLEVPRSVHVKAQWQF
jgi:iron complex outermembrane recepter protein